MCLLTYYGQGRMGQLNFELRVFLALTKGVIQTQGNQALAAC